MRAKEFIPEEKISETDDFAIRTGQLSPMGSTNSSQVNKKRKKAKELEDLFADK